MRKEVKEKALCITADQSQMQRATNLHREDWQGGHKIDAQTQLVAEHNKTLNDAQKQEVCNMIDTLLSQQLNDQQSLDSHSAATENQDSIAWERLRVPADQSKTRSHNQPPQGGWYRYYTDLPPRKQGGTFMNDIIIPAKYRRDLDNAEYQVNAAHALLENIIEPMIHCTTCEGLLIEYSAQTGGDLNKAARAWMEENIDVLYAAEYAAQQLLSEAMDTLQMLPIKEVFNNA